MNKPSTLRLALAAGGAVLALSLGACASGMNNGVNGSTRMGQESTLHTPQGETGAPHGHGSTVINSGALSTSPRASTLGNTGAGTGPGTGAGQESSQHTPQGETGSPHTH